MASVPPRAPVRVPFDHRLDAAPPSCFIESGRNAALDAFNRSINVNTIRLCRLGMICDSPLKCVTCSTHRLAERRADLRAALREAPAAVMVTVTVSHGHDALATQWADFDKILARFTDRGDWSRFKKNHAITGHAVVTEIKQNRNGWNVHAHVILTLDCEPSPETSDRLQDAVRARWSARANQLGHTALPSLQTFSWMGENYSASTMAEYVTKQNLLHHAPDPHSGRYPADLLAGAQQGDADDHDLYVEYLDAASGHALVRQYGHLRKGS